MKKIFFSGKKSVGWSIINITTNEGEIEDWKYMY